MVSIESYAVTREILADMHVTPHLSGRTVIQLSTGTPREARESEAWLQSCGVDYIDSAYENPGATLSVWAGALKRVENQARDAGINCEFPDFVAGLFGRAIAAGHGEKDVAALVKVFRHADGT
jgi:3-hydroxyisobutyrate dehydrogenase-like beta-hydroxyacid dehydrogenase